MARYRNCGIAKILPTHSQRSSQQRWGIAPSRFNRALDEGYSLAHDTAQTRANWTRNPAASSAMADSCAARICDARVQRRLNSPDARPPSPRDWHTDDAGRPAPSDERHPTTGTPNGRCKRHTDHAPHPGLSSRKREALSGTHSSGGTHLAMVLGSPLRCGRDDNHCSDRSRATRTPSQSRTTLTPLIPTKVGTQSIKGDVRWIGAAPAALDPGLRRDERIFESAKQIRGRLSDRAQNQNSPNSPPARPRPRINSAAALA